MGGKFALGISYFFYYKFNATTNYNLGSKELCMAELTIICVDGGLYAQQSAFEV